MKKLLLMFFVVLFPLCAWASVYQLDIKSPDNKASFWNAGGNIPVVLHIRPALASTDTIKLLLDGAPYGTPQSTVNWTLQNVTRGTHQLQAEVLLNNKEAVARTDVVIFYVHQSSTKN